MYFKNILGHSDIKNFLIKEVVDNRIPHGQLFLGAKGSGKLAMAMAFTTYLFCKNRVDFDSCGKCGNCVKMFKLSHPDLHFIFPTISPKTKSSKRIVSESKNCFPEFRKAILENPYLILEDWETSLGGVNKKAGIRKSDIHVMCKLAGLRSYEGVYKVFIVWGADKMNSEANSALLKSLEEPNPNTVFILVSNNHHSILPTVRSRLQNKIFKSIDYQLIVKDLEKKHPELDISIINDIVLESHVNYSYAIKKIKNKTSVQDTYHLFVDWIRLCFLSQNPKARFLDPKTNEKKDVISELINWCNNMNDLKKDQQIDFLVQASEIFREGFLLNFSSPLPKRTSIEKLNFNMLNFSKHVQHHNIVMIFALIDDCYYYLNRYANSKILFLDLSFSLGKELHKKPVL